MQKSKVIKALIVVLSVLLALSILSLAGVWVYNYVTQERQTSATLPDNIITDDTKPTESTATTTTTNGGENPSSSPESTDTTTSTTKKPVDLSEVLQLHNRNTGDNTPFQVPNMFPGDIVKQYYCVRVSYINTITVRFRADVRPGYEKLAEVLKFKVSMPETGEVLYDGLMKDMPSSVNHSLSSGKEKTSELYYEMTAYLDTSVGNDYQVQSLIADFRWWVEETENLVSPPTGVDTSIVPYVGVGAALCLVLILLLSKRRKEDSDEQ